jgi:hypothetical protein
MVGFPKLAFSSIKSLLTLLNSLAVVQAGKAGEYLNYFQDKETNAQRGKVDGMRILPHIRQRCLGQVTESPRA